MEVRKINNVSFTAKVMIKGPKRVIDQILATVAKRKIPTNSCFIPPHKGEYTTNLLLVTGKPDIQALKSYQDYYQKSLLSSSNSVKKLNIEDFLKLPEKTIDAEEVYSALRLGTFDLKYLVFKTGK